MTTPIPTTLHIAPRGWSWHGPNLQHDTHGLPCHPGTSPREIALLEALERIVLEAMHYSPVQRMDSDSYLPECLVESANKALATYGMRVQPSQVVAA